MKILTVCRAGLVRSVSLANVLKLHYWPVDVLTCGIGKHEFGRMNDENTLKMLFTWADNIIVMENHYREEIPLEFITKVLICEVGPDTYGNPSNPILISKVWNWVRSNQEILNIKEHRSSI